MSDASIEPNPVLYEESDGVGLLTINNPAKRNALSSPVLQALKNCLDEITNRQDIRVVIIRAAGPVFSSGHDLRELQMGNRADHATVFGCASQLWPRYRG
jgi:enoyl-CoA hydratase/carnithine racemase